ncbi:MAG TPA: glucoamylase family protein, partial [Deferrisomatales bacterium]|nr:glucoamylase family protein [Deferrisomatales bacterium]
MKLRWKPKVPFCRGDPPHEQPVNESPLRAELLSAEQMRHHGETLAGTHTLGLERAPDRLLPRLDENEGVLIGACTLLTEALTAERRIAPAGDWLLDNFYLIEEQIRTARRHLPKGYSRGLPRLAHGPSAGLPRVYDLALETISHGDGRVDPESLTGFVAAYQTVTVLDLGELWAIPIMLRLALIENLRRVAARMVAGRLDRNRADYWADQITEVAEKDPKSLILATADMARSDPPMVSSFVAEFARRLRGQSPALALPLTWIEQRLAESGLTIERLVESENQQQAADQVSIANSIGSLRFLGAMDWRAFVETMSVVEQTLRQEPGGVYSRMDFATRDRYRHVVERIAKQGPLSEAEVARLALQRARDGSDRLDDHKSHVGFHLIDQGLPEFERLAEVRRTTAGALRRWGSRFPLSLYLGAIFLTTALLTRTALAKAQTAGVGWWLLGLVGILSVLGASHLAVALANWLATLVAKPHLLPRMDFSGGIPPQARTLVVIPTMLTSAAGIEALVEALEVRFLANREENLHFGLLTDFRDACEEVSPEDEGLLGLARKGVEELNEKHASAKNDAFFLFHRPRRWNPLERLWMGYERKRGKLADLNAFLRGGGEDRFSLVVGETSMLSTVKYVITLDTDTQLPRDAARQFVGTMEHPLNRARYDPTKQRVDQGYGILQPRVAESLPSTTRSRYARLCGSEPGIDPYTRAVSDVYQDLFHEGSFIGKGIYEVDAFERAVDGRFPENRILSHDLVEGCYARAGLLSDVQLYEESPSRYAADVARRHRWIRGDWQIAAWVLPRVPGPPDSSGSNAKGRKNLLSPLSRWKIFDNLRRSLVPAALALLLLLGWTVLPSPGFWTLVVVGTLVIPPWLASLLTLLRKPAEVLPSQHLAAVAGAANRQFAQVVFGLACLPYEAYYSLDAIARTAARMLITRKRLLEWNPSGDADRGRRAGFAADLQAMWVGPTLAVAAALGLALFRPPALAVAGPVLALWFASPALVGWLSRPLFRREARLTTDQTLFLRRLSRKTWAFFETFVGPEDHWLPPDNVQEHPVSAPLRVAHRTSPTNMGLSLLANLSAYDFGYLSAGRLVERTAKAFQTMGALERYRGHFYNWYDTQSLRPLVPLYLSSVDSGNLAGHLLTLRPGLGTLPDKKILGARFFEGLADTLGLLDEAAGVQKGVAATALSQFEVDLAACDPRPRTLGAARRCVERLATSAGAVAASLAANSEDPESEATGWAAALAGQCRDALDELALLAPWAGLTDSSTDSGDLGSLAGLDEIKTLRELAELEVGFAAAIAAEPKGETRRDELRRLVSEGSRRARERLDTIARLVREAGELARPDYDLLFDAASHLLAIGYNVGERRRDASYYDLLASEARLATFVAIAQGALPQESWFALGRLLTSAGGKPVLLSWSGSMFEYLMPLLVMPTYEGTLLDQTCRAAVASQIAYGKKRGVPWGISESGYNAIDVSLNYQYRAFGVPGLGLKRGLADDLVVTPYASALALLVAPEEACQNLERLAAAGFEGKYGLYEAIDYTPSRVPRGQTSAVVRSFMAHHQGMSLLAFAALLLGRPMQRRFASDPAFQATALLLQERIPKRTARSVFTTEAAEARASASGPELGVRVFVTPHTATPEVQLLSNGRYHVMVTNAGGGYSHWKDLAVTRWREDTTCDDRGTFCYLRDVTSREFWSTAYQPTRKGADTYEAIFSEARAEFRVRRHDIDAHTEIAVSPEDDIELRRVTITNRSGTRRTIEVTSYAEVVLAPPAADALHPAFGNLFVQTEILRERQAILCTRRPRSAGEPAPWMFHLMVVHGVEVGESSYETDRARFLGRGNTVAAPQALTAGTELSGSEGSVLDPIVAIRQRITLEPEGSATVNIVSGMGETREACLALVGKYQDQHLAERVLELAWTNNQVFLRQINATEADAQLYGRLAGSVLYSNSALRADPSVLVKNRRGQPGLWGYSISGDLPIVVLQIGDPANIGLVRQLVQAHAYWRLKGLAVDLVIWTEDHAGYRQLLHEQILGLIAAGGQAHTTDRPGGIFVRPGDQIPDEDRILLQTVARALLTDARGTLAEQLGPRRPAEVALPALVPLRARNPDPAPPPPSPRADLLFFNGLGGFTPDGREYVITTAHGQVTPAPWANVLANPHFGTVISESGSAYTWSENAHEFRLT